jgi:hypothetical protein
MRNENTLKNSYLLKNDKQKNMSCTMTTISINYNKLQKQLLQNSLYEKKNLGKGHAILF